MSTFGAFAIVQTFLTTWALGELCLPACGRDRYLMVLLAVFSFAGQILLTMALQREQAGPVAIARSADVVFAFIWQVSSYRLNSMLHPYCKRLFTFFKKVVFLDEIPGWLSLIGALLVTTSVLITMPNPDPVRQRFRFLK